MNHVPLLSKLQVEKWLINIRGRGGVDVSYMDGGIGMD